MSLNRREMLRLGAVGAGGCDALVCRKLGRASVHRLCTAAGSARPAGAACAPQPTAPARHQSRPVPEGQGRARFAPLSGARPRLHRHRRFLQAVERGALPRRRSCTNGQVESYRVAHGRGSDPDHRGFLERFSNDFGSLRDFERHLHDRRLLRRQVRPFDEGPRPRLDQQQRRSARHRHPQRLVCRAAT